jgi:hypothetical protein
MSNLLGNMLFNTSFNSEANTKVDFINKYSNFAEKYDKITPLGDQKRTWPYLISILLLVGVIFCFIYSKEKENKETGEKIPRNNLQKILYYFGWVLLIMFIISLIYNGYYYFVLYLPQYNEWFNNLPLEAKNQLNIIKTLESITNNMKNKTNNINRY